MDQFHDPRPCVQASAELSPVEYYRGQYALQYNIFEENDDFDLIVDGQGTVDVTFISGEDAADLVSVDFDSGDVFVQTDDEVKEGEHQILIRVC